MAPDNRRERLPKSGERSWLRQIDHHAQRLVADLEKAKARGLAHHPPTLLAGMIRTWPRSGSHQGDARVRRQGKQLPNDRKQRKTDAR
jgi:hypothetical protein